VLNSFGVICFGLVGLELASVMGDEIQDPQKTLPPAVAWGGVISGVLYIGATLTLLIAIGKNVSVLQGIVQAVTHMAGKVGVSLDHRALRVDAESCRSRESVPRGWVARRAFRSSQASIPTCRRGLARFIRATQRPMLR
jgi:hypothetical protein